jgi:hypothetical protein
MTGWAAHAVLVVNDSERVVCAATREMRSEAGRREIYIMSGVANIFR